MIHNYRTLTVGAAALALSTTLACASDDAAGDDELGETGTETGGDATDTGAEQSPSYWQDVAPIYYERCVACHTADGVAPFALDDYENAAAWAELSAGAVEDRTMPPWLVVDDGSCGDWADSPVLEQDEIDTIRAWVEAGVPEGTPRDDLEPPTNPGLDGAVSFATPEFVPEPQGGMFAAYDEYRCFAIDPELATDQFITAYEVEPGNKALIHHVLAMPVDPDRVVEGGQTNLEIIEALDGESPEREGWPCFGLAGEGVEVSSIPVTWAPGQGTVEFPADSGSRIQAGDLLVVQVHYNMVEAELLGQSDSSTVNLRLADEVAREGYFDLPDGLLDGLFTGDPEPLPPGEEEVEFTWTLEADWYLQPGQEQLEFWGFFPHMHEQGTSMSVRILDAQDQEIGCYGEVPRWDFGWQLYYFYEQPVVLQPGDKLEVTCRYDTTGFDEPLWPGWGTGNEMCLAGVYFVP